MPVGAAMGQCTSFMRASVERSGAIDLRTDSRRAVHQGAAAAAGARAHPLRRMGTVSLRLHQLMRAIEKVGSAAARRGRSLGACWGGRATHTQAVGNVV